MTKGQHNFTSNFSKTEVSNITMKRCLRLLLRKRRKYRMTCSIFKKEMDDFVSQLLNTGRYFYLEFEIKYFYNFVTAKSAE